MAVGNFFGGEFFGGNFFGTVGGAGGVAKWPGRSEAGWEKWWKKEHAKKLLKSKQAAEKRVEKAHQKVLETRRAISFERELEAIQKLLKALERYQKRLEEEQAILDELEMQEVALLWAVWQRG